MTKSSIIKSLHFGRTIFAFSVYVVLFISALYFLNDIHEKKMFNLAYSKYIFKEQEVSRLNNFLNNYEVEYNLHIKKVNDTESIDGHFEHFFPVLFDNGLSNAFFSIYRLNQDGQYDLINSGGVFQFKSLHEIYHREPYIFQNLRLENMDISSLVFRELGNGDLLVSVGFIDKDIADSSAKFAYQVLFLNSLNFAFTLFLLLLAITYFVFRNHRLNVEKQLYDIDKSVQLEHKTLKSKARQIKSQFVETLSEETDLKKERKDLEKAIISTIKHLRETSEHLRKENEKMESLNAELHSARIRAHEASMVKTEFLANMSHEVRTPIHGILSYSSFGLKRFENTKDPRQKHYLDKIADSADRLLIFVSDLVVLSDLESGRLTYVMTECMLQDILRSSLAGLDRLTREKKIAFSLPYTDVKLRCDYMRIKQVFQNIYSNALKFSPENEIIYTDISISNGFLVVGITDSGAGVDESERELIFEKFVQSERTKTGAGGIGLGLAICREIVLGHGGKIYVEDNSTGRGSRFVVELPISGN